MQHSMSPFPCCISASPNWYCSNIGDAKKSGIFLFGGKNSVYKVDLEGPIKCVGAVISHTKKTSAVCLVDLTDVHFDDKQSAEIFQERIFGASGGEDGIVRLWNIQGKKLVKGHDKHDVPVTSIAADPSQFILLSGDAKGFIITWNFKDDVCHKWCPVHSGIIHMALCPHDKSLLCVGYANGHTVICNYAKQQICRTYKNHIDEICTLAWCPDKSVTLDAKDGKMPTKGYLLASSSKDKTIKIYDISSDGPYMSLSVPSKVARKGRRDDHDKARTWISLCWLHSDVLISGSNSGELLQWNLQTRKSSVVSGNHHNRAIFSISYDQKTDSLITTSMDRQINIFRTADFSLKSSLPSHGGFVYCMASSPVDPYSVVYGVGDNTIRCWQTGQDRLPFKTAMHWQGIKAKVTAIAFHPYKDNMVAFGQSDGRVGVYSLAPSKCQISASYHQKTVYSISFGPGLQFNGNGGSDKVSCIYSCGGEGIVLMHNLKELDKRAVDIHTIMRKHTSSKTDLPLRSEVSWHQDLQLVAIGNDNGSIDIFKAPHLQQVATIPYHKKIINCMKWHPSMPTYRDDMNCSFWLSSGSNDNKVYVTDVSGCEGSTVKTLTPVRSFTSHSGRITCIDWSSHSSGVAVFGSYDCTVQVWDVVKDISLANFREHQSRVLCVLWSLVDSNVIYSGDEEFNIYRWRIEDQQYNTPPERVDYNDKWRKKPAVKPSSSKTPTEETKATTEIPMAPHSNGIPNSAEVDQPTPIRSLDVTSPKLVKPKDKDSHGTRKRGKSLLPLCAVADQKDKATAQMECLLLAGYLHEQSSGVSEEQHDNDFEATIGKCPNLGLYSDWMDALKVIDAEGHNHVENKSVDQAIQLQLWQSNVDKALSLALKEGHLTEFLVSLSPMAGTKVWKEVSLKYAEQLASRGLYHQAASYYVAINKPKAAVEMFKDKGMFREALVLAKVRLSPEDPIINDLYSTWRNKLLAEGAAEQAAKCYLALGETVQAIHCLGKKGDPSSLETAAKVAAKTDHEDLCRMYTEKSVFAYVNTLNWLDAHRILDAVMDSKVLRLFVIASEALWFTLGKCLTQNPLSEATPSTYWSTSWPCDGKDSESLSGLNLNGRPLIGEILSIWSKKEGIANIEELRSIGLLVEDFEKSLKSTIYSKEKTPEEVLLGSARPFTTGSLHLLHGNVYECLSKWLEMFSSLCDAGEYYAIEVLYQLLLPRNAASIQEYWTNFPCPEKLPDAYQGHGLIKHFDGFFAAAGLYNMALATDTATATATATASVKSTAVFTTVCQSTTCALHSRYWMDVDIGIVLSYLCTSLLSYWHYLLYVCRTDVERLEGEVKKLEFTREVARRYIGPKKDDSKREQATSSNTGTHEYLKEQAITNEKNDTTVTEDVKSESENGVETKVPANSYIGPNFNAMFDECERKLQDVHAALESTTCKLECVPDIVKKFPFPDPRKSIAELKSLLERLLSKEQNNTILSHLHADVTSFEALVG